MKISVDELALAAARVLSKYGVGTPDWDEWRDLKNALLKIHPSLGVFAKQKVGQSCSDFNQELAKVLNKERKRDEELLDDF